MSTETNEYPLYGAGVVVACTCGRGDDQPIGHDVDCKGSVAVGHAITMAGVRGVCGGVLTEAEEDLLSAVACLVRDRRGERGGAKGNIDLGHLARRSIRAAAAKICDQADAQQTSTEADGPDPDALEVACEAERRGIEEGR